MKDYLLRLWQDSDGDHISIRSSAPLSLAYLRNLVNLRKFLEALCLDSLSQVAGWLEPSSQHASSKHAPFQHASSKYSSSKYSSSKYSSSKHSSSKHSSSNYSDTWSLRPRQYAHYVPREIRQLQANHQLQALVQHHNINQLQLTSQPKLQRHITAHSEQVHAEASTRPATEPVTEPISAELASNLNPPTHLYMQLICTDTLDTHTAGKRINTLDNNDIATNAANDNDLHCNTGNAGSCRTSDDKSNSDSGNNDNNPDDGSNNDMDSNSDRPVPD